MSVASSFVSERYLKGHIFSSLDHSDEIVFTRAGALPVTA